MAENGGTRVEYSVCIVAALIVKLNRDFVFISTKCFTRLHYFTLVSLSEKVVFDTSVSVF